MSPESLGVQPSAAGSLSPSAPPIPDANAEPPDDDQFEQQPREVQCWNCCGAGERGSPRWDGSCDPCPECKGTGYFDTEIG